MNLRERYQRLMFKLGFFMILWRNRGFSMRQSYDLVKRVSVDVALKDNAEKGGSAGN